MEFSKRFQSVRYESMEGVTLNGETLAELQVIRGLH